MSKDNMGTGHHRGEWVGGRKFLSAMQRSVGAGKEVPYVKADMDSARTSSVGG